VSPTASRSSAVDVGCAADGVLEPGDVIVGATGKDVSTPRISRACMSRSKPGDEVTLRIERGAAEQTVTVGTKASDDHRRARSWGSSSSRSSTSR
jgi:S1-C subfamily serine protease